MKSVIFNIGPCVGTLKIWAADEKERVHTQDRGLLWLSGVNEIFRDWSVFLTVR